MSQLPGRLPALLARFQSQGDGPQPMMDGGGSIKAQHLAFLVPKLPIGSCTTIQLLLQPNHAFLPFPSSGVHPKVTLL